MKRDYQNLRNLKVGAFLLASLAILAWVTLNIRDLPFMTGSHESVTIIFSSARGLRVKTPVELAGIPVGYVDKISLVHANQAKVVIQLDASVKLPKDTQAFIKSKGFLGETYIELFPGRDPTLLSAQNARITGQSSTDLSALTDDASLVMADLKAITAALRTTIEGDDSRFNRIMAHIDTLTQALASVTERNTANIDKIAANLAQLSGELRLLVNANHGNIDETLNRIANVSRSIDEGKGSLGRLVNDDATVEKLNESLDNLNSALGGVSQLQTEIGYHTEYLGTTKDFKHYVSLALKPRPDKFFLLELVNDPAPGATRTSETRTITSGGVSSEVTTDTKTTQPNHFLFSAQLAKKIDDLTLRGGVIESSGGVGIDYDKGPFGVSISAFDLENNETERPHLKAWAHGNITDTFFVMGGVDDFISKQQDPDWFVGAGIRLIDDDVKSLLGSFKLGR